MNFPSRASILVIDDEQQIRRFLRISLVSQGYTVLEAENASHGLEITSAAKPDLVVLDLGLPDADGKRVLEQIREWSNVPVIVLSVRCSETEKVLSLDSGANDYVTKPFGIREFLARVRNLLRSSAESPEAEPSFDDGLLRIDLPSRRISLNGKPVHLTPKEYRVIAMLVQNAGRVVTQTHLLREIWGPSHADHRHYLRVVVGKIRQKIGDDAENPRYLETEPGIGYRFLGDRCD